MLLRCSNVTAGFLLDACIDSCIVSLLLRALSIERIVIKLNESAADFVACDLRDLHLAELARTRRLRRLFYLKLVIGALDLAKSDTVCGNGQDQAAEACLWLQIRLGDLVDPVDDERLSKRAVEPSVALGRLCNARQDNPADGKLRKEVVVLLIAELVEPGSHGHVVRDLNEAAGLGDVSDIPQCQITLLECQRSAVL